MAVLSKSALLSKKVCYKVSLCENRRQQSCKAFISLSFRAKMVGGDVPFYVRIRSKPIHPFKTPIFNLLPYSASAVTPSKKVQLTQIKCVLRAFQ